MGVGGGRGSEGDGVEGASRLGGKHLAKAREISAQGRRRSMSTGRMMRAWKRKEGSAVSVEDR